MTLLGRPRAFRLLTLPILAALLVGALALTAAGSDRGPDAGRRTEDVASAAGPATARARASRALPRLYSRDLALGIVIGYSFSDGRIVKGTYPYEQGGEGLGDQFRAAILDAGGLLPFLRGLLDEGKLPARTDPRVPERI